MTLLTRLHFTPAAVGTIVAPCELALSDLTVVVPVKNNQDGVARLLEACRVIFAPENSPKEILLIDNLSSPPLDVSAQLASFLSVRTLICSRPGAAAARNLGVRQARTRWILFLDSDCLPTPGLIDGYRQALNGAVAYVGTIRADRNDPISQYYETQEILKAPPIWISAQKRPAYLITANTLIWREALVSVGGFDETFPSAAGEDIDLGLRLWSVGPLAYAPAAQSLHVFEPYLHAFTRRFVRYGRGNRLLAVRYQVDLAPRPFAPNHLSLVNWCLAGVQFLCLWWGYRTTRPPRDWSPPATLVQ